MKVYLDCIPCFLKQTVEAAKLATEDSNLHQQCIKEVLRRIYETPWNTSPPHIGYVVHSTVKKVCNNQDPYKNIKKRSNEIAKKLYKRLQKEVCLNPDPFLTSLKISLIGNVIDFGARPGEKLQLDHEIMDFENVKLEYKYVLTFKEKVKKAKKILFLGDNAGEIVLDRFLLEQIGPKKITYVVKNGPIINDATMEDAEDSGLKQMVRVITNGTDYPGTPLELCSKEFLTEFNKSDLVISKGQGNYETLSEIKKPIFFILKVKCPVVAKDINRQVGDFVVLGKNI